MTSPVVDLMKLLMMYDERYIGEFVYEEFANMIQRPDPDPTTIKRLVKKATMNIGYIDDLPQVNQDELAIVRKCLLELADAVA